MAEPQTQNPPAQTPSSEATIQAEPQVRPRHTFKYYIHDSVSSLRLQLFGDCGERDVPELRGCWNTVKTTLGDRKLVLDLCKLHSADVAARRWFYEMAAESATFLPESYNTDGILADSSGPPALPRTRRLVRLLGLIRGSSAAEA